MIKSRAGVKVTAKQKAEEKLYQAVLLEANRIYTLDSDFNVTNRELEQIKQQVNKLVQRIGKLLHQDIECSI